MRWQTNFKDEVATYNFKDVVAKHVKDEVAKKL